MFKRLAKTQPEEIERLQGRVDALEVIVRQLMRETFPEADLALMRSAVNRNRGAKVLQPMRQYASALGYELLLQSMPPLPPESGDENAPS